MKQVRRNISLDSTTNKALIELANSHHKSVSQWITDCVWEKANNKDVDTVSAGIKIIHGDNRHLT